MSQKTRSTLTIDAVAQAAATGVAHALNPLRKLDNIAGLAGFVLRLFRSREQLPGKPAQRLRRMQEGSKREVRGKTGAGGPTAGPRPASLQNGGTRHG